MGWKTAFEKKARGILREKYSKRVDALNWHKNILNWLSFVMKSFWSQTSKKHLSSFHALNLFWKVTSINIIIIILTVNKILEQYGDI